MAPLCADVCAYCCKRARLLSSHLRLFSSFSNGTKLEQIVQAHRTSYLSGWPRGSSKIQSSLLNIYFRLCGFHASPRSYYSLPLRSEYPAAFTLQQSVAQNLYDMWRSTFEISEAQLHSVTKIAPKITVLICE